VWALAPKKPHGNSGVKLEAQIGVNEAEANAAT
jgi:hypothetical protein